jgi:two-component system LytT family sensor kinase
MRIVSWQRWLPPLAVYTALGVFTATEILLLYRHMKRAPPPLASVVATEMLHWYVWGALTLLIGLLVRAFPFRRGRLLRSVLAHVLAGGLIAASHLVAYIILTWPVPQRWYTDESSLAFAKNWDYLFSARFNTNVLTYFGILAVLMAREFSRRIRAEELARTRLEAQLANARLAALKMQLHPHFLFNTLNAISALVPQDPPAAERMLQLLSDLLRQALAEAATQEVPLRREVDFLQTYLEIERVRFGDRLHVEFDVAPEAWDAMVPNLILQPLVENAIRHGISRVSRAGRIDVAARQSGPDLVMVVRDDGPGFPPMGSLREGVGLGATRARLRELYGPAQEMEFRNEPGGGARVSIRIPLRLSSLPSPQPEPSLP